MCDDPRPNDVHRGPDADIPSGEGIPDLPEDGDE